MKFNLKTLYWYGNLCLLSVFLLCACENKHGKESAGSGLAMGTIPDCSIDDTIRESKELWIKNNTKWPTTFGFVYDPDASQQKGEPVFTPSATEKEKEVYFDSLFDNVYGDIPGGGNTRFDRKFIRYDISKNKSKAYEKKLEYLLYKCLYMRKNKFSFVNKVQPPSLWVSTYDPDPIIKKYIEPNFLTPYMSECAAYLHNNGKINMGEITDFSYKDRSGDQLDSLNENIYLTARAAGLTRRLLFLYYPNSLLRKHADTTGLSLFIFKCEKHAGKALNHEELATKHFGSYQKWMDSLNTYLDGQMLRNAY